ncbi:MAG: hypothetical protein II870_04195 [Synergistaceae bacterium]|nr:hypothetical protein [Synergistaceae bacterium]
MDETLTSTAAAPASESTAAPVNESESTYTPQPQETTPITGEPGEQATAQELTGDNEIGVDDNGDLTISNSFFNDESKPESPQPKPEEQGLSDDYLRDTPFEQWDESKIKGDVSRYLPFMKEQLARRQAQANFIQQQQQIQQQNAENIPKPYTPKELAADGKKLAAQRLGLDSDEDIDMYEPDHYAAMQQAVKELNEQREAQIRNYQGLSQAQMNFGAYMADLQARPYFKDFDNFFTASLAKTGQTPQMVIDYVKRTGKYNDLQRTVETMHRRYLEMQHNANKSKARVPNVENTNNAVATGGRVFNLSAFREMNDDEQAQALINAGYVNI